MLSVSTGLVLLLSTLSAQTATLTNWSVLRTPGFWEKRFGGVIEEHDGFAWYRCFVNVPADWAGQALQLALGQIDDCDQSFFNGREVGARGKREPYRSASGEARNYPIEPGLVRFGGVNLIAVRVWDGGGAGGLATGPLTLGCARGTLDLRGRWQFRTGDDLAWAQWPAPPESPGVAPVVADFLAAAGTGFGRLKVPVVPDPLAGTERLTLEGDIASQLLAGVDRFLLRELDQSEARRERHWKRDHASPEAYAASVDTNRARLAHLLGVRDRRVRFAAPELLATTTQPALVAKANDYDVLAIRWPALEGIHGEGLLLAPRAGRGVAQVIAIPDATQTPEQLAGLEPGLAADQQYARRLAENGCRVIIPAVIGREMGPHKGRARMTAREFLYRPAFELGRHLIGYEVQKILALVDWLAGETGTGARIGVVGWGDGGLLTLYAAALDPRIAAAGVSGYFGDRRAIWQQPIDRSVFGLLVQSGDAELASLVHPRRLIVEAARAPEARYSGQGGGAPAEVATPPLAEVRREVERAQRLCRSEGPDGSVQLVVSQDGAGPGGSAEWIERVLAALSPGAGLEKPAQPLTPSGGPLDHAARQARQMQEIDAFTQRLLVESPFVRAEFMKRLDPSSPERYRETVEGYREFFATEVIGRFDQPLLPANARSRKVYEEETWTGYEVALDVFPEVIAYGLLLLPNDLKPGQKRPVVVCQHGLEGRPQDTIGDAGSQYYSAFSARLAERGFVTFAPQNLYIFGDRFRTLQRKAYPLGKTLFSVIVPQHQQITDWLKTLPFVDPARIGFYGLSYGGKSAMRIPPLVRNYCLSICSADFNEWVWKNASTRSPYSYVWGGEYEIFEFDLGSTFNYAEMAALIAPRPFMVERGHFDGVAPDETVGYEFAKVRHLYAARLRLPPETCRLEWFVGPHQIHGVGTYDFLHRHLNWPAP